MTSEGERGQVWKVEAGVAIKQVCWMRHEKSYKDNAQVSNEKTSVEMNNVMSD